VEDFFGKLGELMFPQVRGQAVPSRPWAYSPALDQLRFFAATLVMVFHFRPVLEIPPHTHGLRFFIENWVRHGFMGVSLFLVLTGFLFTMNYDLGARPINYKPFIIKRFLRIAPMYVLMMLLLQTQMRATWTVDSFLTFLLFQVNTGNPITGFGHDVLPIGPIWTIAVEVQFYLIFPLVLAAFPPKNWRRTLGMLVVLNTLRLMLSWYTLGPDAYFNIYHTMFGRFDQFLIGMQAAYVFKLVGPWLTRRRAYGLAVLSIALLTVWINHVGERTYPGNIFSFTVEAVCFAGLIVGFHAGGGIGTLFGKCAQKLGEASYSVYLLHLFVGVVLMQHFGNSLPQWLSGPVVKPVVLVMLPSWMLALMTYRIIELPFMHLGRGHLSQGRARGQN
jgi:peptidoglycan/LPS O-acetylase OafA/YrhL